MSSTSASERRVPILHVVTMVLVPIVASLPWIRMEASIGLRYAASAGLIVLGVALMVWAMLHLRMRLRISPLSSLVTTGPFRLFRHPFYVGIAIVLLGTCAKVASGIGLAAWLGIHLPITIWRMRLENRALEAKFGDAWRAYRSLF